jgi:hypothetical protein
MGWAKYEEDNYEIAMERLYLWEDRQQTVVMKAPPSTPVVPVSIVLMNRNNDTQQCVSNEIIGCQFTDKQLQCQDCGNKFRYSASFQKVVRDNNWIEPKRCRACRLIRKSTYIQRTDSTTRIAI